MKSLFTRLSSTVGRMSLITALVAFAPAVVADTNVITGRIIEFTSPDDLLLDPATAVIAVDLYGDADRDVNGVTFQTDGQDPAADGGTVMANGVTVTTSAVNEINDWAAAPAFTGGTGDSAANLAEIMRDIRWHPNPGPITITASGLEPGGLYNVQLLTNEGGDRNRRWDIAVNGQLAVDDYTSEGDSATGVWTPENSFAYSGDFYVPANGALEIVLATQLGGTPFPGGDGNAILQGVVIHSIDAPTPTTKKLYAEDFEGIPLHNDNVDEALEGMMVWTHTPPPAWSVDNSGVAGTGDPDVGVIEWEGWSFANKDWWVETAGDQRRSEFTLGQGTVAVADPDEWDDKGSPSGIGTFNAFLSTPPIDVSGALAGSLTLQFDSTFRPEVVQRAAVDVSYDGGAPINVLEWIVTDDEKTNEAVSVSLANPGGAQSAVVTFSMTDAGNNWFWAIDNICVTADFAPSNPFAGLRQEWWQNGNPGNRAGVEGVFSSRAPDNGPFRGHDSGGSGTWWTGNGGAIPGIQTYPPVTTLGRDNYMARLTGQINFPEPGEYKFKDGVDDYTFLSIDLNGNGVEDDGEVLVDDNAWTGTEGNQNGGSPIVTVTAEAGWVDIVMYTAEGGGGDAGVLYWDYAKCLYQQDFSGLEDGATDLGDGSIVTNPQGGAGVQDGALNLTTEGIGGQAGDYKLPVIDGLGDGFTIEMDVALSEMPGGNPPADGFSFNFGAIADDASAGEEGHADGLVVSFDTWDNGGEGADTGIGVDLRVDGAEVAQNRIGADEDKNDNSIFKFDGVSRKVLITYDPADGGKVSVIYGGNVLYDGTAVGWAPEAGDRIAFGARTGGAWETLTFDNICVSPASGIGKGVGFPAANEDAIDLAANGASLLVPDSCLRAFPPEDIDGDDIPDEVEIALFGDLSQNRLTDFDGDRLANGDELDIGTDPTDKDSDGDGLWDGEEHHTENRYATNPLNADSDGDGISDGDELFVYGTDPNNADTDGDMLNDGFEVENACLYAQDFSGGTGRAELLACWDFEGNGNDAVSGIVGEVMDGTFTDGKNGQGYTGGWINVTDGAEVFNVASARDEMTVALWLQANAPVNSSAFWFGSPTTGNNNRAFQAHVPWGNGSIFFDTAGCCDANVTRINGDPTGFNDFAWNDGEFHHFVFEKKGDQKRIYIDGALWLEGGGTADLPTDINRLAIGSEFGNNIFDGVMDDLAVYAGALSQAEIDALAGGASPKDVVVGGPETPIDLGDGSIVTNPQGGADIVDGALNLTTEGIGGQAGNYLLPVFGGISDGFTVTLDLALAEEAGGNPPADGFSLSLGAIPDDAAAGEEGHADGLVVSFDTWDNGGEGADTGIGVDLRVDNAEVAQNRIGADEDKNDNSIFKFDGVFRDVTITYTRDGDGGAVSVNYGGNLLHDNVAVAWAPEDGDRFAFGARTGGAWETLTLDNICIAGADPLNPLAFNAPSSPFITGGTVRNIDFSEGLGDLNGALPILNGAPEGLIGFYPFDEADPLADASGSGNTLTSAGADPAYDAGGGVSGGAYVYDGTQRLVAPIDVNPGVIPEMTMGAWVKTADLTPALRKVMGSDNGGWDRTIGLDNREGDFRYTAFTGDGPPVVGTPTPANTDDWTFLAAVHSQASNEITVYVDLDSSSTDDDPVAVTEPTLFNASRTDLSIGSLRADNANEGWIGAIDNAFVFNRSLSAAEIKALRDGGAGAFAVPDPSVIASEVTVPLESINYRDDGGERFFPGDRPYPVYGTFGGHDFIGIDARGTINVPTPGVWTFLANSDDGVIVWIDGTIVVDDRTNHGTRADINDPVIRGAIDLSAGEHSIRVSHYEQGGGAAVEVGVATQPGDFSEGGGQFVLLSTPDPAKSLLVSYDFEDGVSRHPWNTGIGRFGDGTLASEDGIDRARVLNSYGTGSPSPNGQTVFSTDGNQWIDTGATAAELGINGPNAPYTMTAWMKPNNPRNGDQMIFGQRDGNALHNGIRDGRLHIGNWGSDLNSGASTVSFNQWQHVAFVSSGSELTAYLNGVPFMDGHPDNADRGLLNPDNNVVIGQARDNLGRAFEGYLDDVRIYGTVLTGDQIRSIAGFGDSDGDGLEDSWERANFGDLAMNGTDDPDGDGLNNAGEQEVGGDPLLADTDGDGSSDAAEFKNKTDLADADTDDDGLGDGDEAAAGTNPLVADTDGDGFDDGAELAGFSDPLDPASTPSGVPSVIDSGAFASASELDFSGDFPYAINVGGPGGFSVGDAAFTEETPAVSTDGVTFFAQNHIPAWENGVPAFGEDGNSDDEGLRTVFESIRWSGFPNDVTADFSNIVPGDRYKVQMFFNEECCDRGWAIYVNDVLVQDDFNPRQILGGVESDDMGVFFSIEFNPGSDVISVRLDDPTTAFADRNPILNGITVEKVGGAPTLLLDFAGDGPNSSGVSPAPWISINNLVQDEPVDLGGGVTITALDDGFDPNNPAPPGEAATYDGIEVPQEARDDYLFKIDDTAGTEARMRIDGLPTGLYNVTAFEGRTTDANQVAKIWVGDEPAEENTGSFAGGSATVTVSVADGESLWYKHLEDNSGGISGMIIRPVSVGAPLLAAGDTVFGGQLNGDNFDLGVSGTTGEVNNWPGGEPPSAAIDGQGQKYLNFAEFNTGIVVTPSSGPSIATGLKLWAANDAVPRDPASYEVYGTNAALGDGPFAKSDFTLLGSGSLALPDSRNGGGAAALDDANAQFVAFGNSTGYESYMIVFPTVKDEAGANSMQIAEIQLLGGPVPAGLLVDYETDSDGDGMSDFVERQTLTDPFDSSDYLHISSIETRENGWQVRVATVPGLTYELEFSETLASDSWERLDAIVGDGRETVIDVENHMDGSRASGFFRIRLKD